VQKVLKDNQPAVGEGLPEAGGKRGIRYGSPGVGKNEQVPATGAVVERFGCGLHGMDAHSTSSRRFAGEGESLFRDVESSNIPTTQSQKDCIAALSHRDVQRLTRLDGPNGLLKKRVALLWHLFGFEDAVKEYP
jgi:hypothetical protein